MRQSNTSSSGSSRRSTPWTPPETCSPASLGELDGRRRHHRRDRRRHDRLPHRGPPMLLGPGSVPGGTSPPADAKRLQPGAGTATSKRPWALPPCRQPDNAAPTCAPSTDASPPAAELAINRRRSPCTRKVRTVSLAVAPGKSDESSRLREPLHCEI